MQTFDAAKLFKFNQELADHQTIIVNHVDVQTVGTNVHKPVGGFTREAGLVTEPYIKLVDGSMLTFPDLPENHKALATLSEFYRANTTIVHMQNLSEYQKLNRNQKREMNQATNTILEFQNKYQ